MAVFIYHEAYQTYRFGPQHPFRPVRYAMVLDLLDALDARPALTTPPAATREDLLHVHSAPFVDAVEAASREGAGEARCGLEPGDTPAFRGMDAAARHVVGGTLHGARLIARGEARHVLQMGGGLHHAHRGRAAGFCVYNDLAVAIRHLTAEGLRVAYLDIDVHHGDGVQSIFYEAPDVLTVSLHESGRFLYPGTGFPDELGEGAGTGLKLNVPLAPSTCDASYLDAFERVVPHVLGWFGPDVLVVQAGADAHAADPLAHLRLSTHAYARLFDRLIELAEAHAGGRVLLTFGGGYALSATPRIWTLLALKLMGRPLPEALPQAWRARWTERLGAALERPLPAAFHDHAPAEEDEPVARANRTTCRRLLSAAAKRGY